MDIKAEEDSRLGEKPASGRPGHMSTRTLASRANVLQSCDCLIAKLGLLHLSNLLLRDGSYRDVTAERA